MIHVKAIHHFNRLTGARINKIELTSPLTNSFQFTDSLKGLREKESLRIQFKHQLWTLAQHIQCRVYLMNGFDRNLLSLDIYIERNLSSQLLKHMHSCVLSLYFPTMVTSVQQKRRVYCSATYFKFKDKNKKEQAPSSTKRAQNQQKSSQVPNRVVISNYTCMYF